MAKHAYLAWIENNSVWRASVKKSREGLMKKVMELPTLCGVEGGLIIYSLDKLEPIVWSSHNEVQSLLKKFYQKASKSQDQLKKQNRKTKEVKVGQFILQIDQGETIDDFYITKLDNLICIGNACIEDKDTFQYFPLQDWLKDNINANDIGGKARSKIRSEIGLTYHDPLIATIRDDLVALVVQAAKILLQQHLVFYYSTKGTNASICLGDYLLGLVERISRASDFVENLLRFFGGANNNHGTISSHEMGPFDEKH
ncbi:hypothetical protein ES319_D06G101100v1 [Gossypium barbadense]|uniref:MADS-box domain-containing protein n=1 Tax=Gossypium barbadense TaxID=3634 RepID=A0A5J5R1M0_GOSBA|nr:hypothetical protein ES319_D06G101100v1 [Gossypium barbadense]